MKSCLLVTLLFWSCAVFGQAECGFNHALNYLESRGIDWENEWQKSLLEFNSFEDDQTFERRKDVIVIPVHVIIVHKTGQAIGQGSNHSIEKIQSQIDVLNEDFQALNADYSSIPSIFQSASGNPDIEFCLAAVDPQGNISNGITRYAYDDFITATSQIESEIKPNTIWNSSQYLNIWSVQLPGTLLGYAYLPGTAPANIDGVTISEANFGRDFGAVPPYNKGRTCTHEVGHYLGLLHPWGTCPTSQSCCGQDDGISDTPNQEGPTGGCPNQEVESCGSVDMTFNYMNYVHDLCMYTFSNEQSTRMRTTLETIRSGLAERANNVCTFQLKADFELVGNEICASTNLAVNNTSKGDPNLTITYEWEFPGGEPETFSGKNPPSIKYDNPGAYELKLTVNDGVDQSNKKKSINVIDCTNLGVDTIDNLNGAELVLISNTAQPPADGGYVAGHNGFTDIAKAEYFDESKYGDNEFLVGAEYFFAVANADDESTKLECVVWNDEGSNGSPGDALATTEIIISEIPTDRPTYVEFDGPLPINGPFYVGFRLDYSNNTEIAIATNNDGETNPTTAWEQWSSDNLWYPFNDYTNSNTTWEIDIALAIRAHVGSIVATSKPVAGFEALDTDICAGGGLRFKDESINLPMEWIWVVESEDTIYKQNPILKFNSPGEKDVTLIVGNNIGYDTLFFDDLVTVYDAPETPSIDASGDTLFLERPIRDVTYQWYRNGQPIFDANGVEYIAIENGLYELRLIDINGCRSTSNQIEIDQNTGILNRKLQLNIDLLPVPVTKILEYRLGATTVSYTDFKLNILDYVGRSVYREEEVSQRSSLNLEFLAPGIYVFSIADKRQIVGTKTFIKE